jgi:arylformamidase
MIYDITPPIVDALEVWPSDAPPSREVLLDMKRGANLTIPSVLLGARVETRAPDSGSLDAYLGPCQVVRVAVENRARIEPRHMRADIRAERVVFATGTYPASNHFSHEFAGIAPETVEFLADRGARLVGIDTPSVDPYDAEDLAAHRACLRRKVAILEGIVLDDVPEGVYELIALPLRLVGFDASPVRAILRTLDPERSGRSRR